MKPYTSDYSDSKSGCGLIAAMESDNVLNNTN